MPEIISRKEAMARRLQRYFTGEPCRWGHICQRITSNTECRDCGLIRRRKHYHANIEKMREAARIDARLNPERGRRWVQLNRERINRRTKLLRARRSAALQAITELGVET